MTLIVSAKLVKIAVDIKVIQNRKILSIFETFKPLAGRIRKLTVAGQDITIILVKWL